MSQDMMDRFHIEKLSPEQWRKLSKDVHLVAFHEVSDPAEDRIDYALLIVDRQTPAGYMTVKEMDGGTAYLQHGGAFPNHAGTVHAFRQYSVAIKELSAQYDYIWTRIENTNTAMIKMALNVGFVINGTYFHEPKLYLELLMDCTGFY